MAHTFRKYLSNRGSALFMVLSTMTALMIAVMAMYFSVISSRQTTFATFFQKQSYQSAISLNDMVLAGLMDGSLTGGDADLLSVLSEMSEGETITTGANGFASLDSSQAGSDIEQMGAYTMDITRLPNEIVNGKDNMTFDIVTTTMNNGVTDTVHTYVHVELAGEEIPNGDNIFAATGYVPNDTYLDAGKYMTDVFFDTEFTYISLYNSACVFAGGLRAGGSVIINNSFQAMTDGTNIGGSAVISGRYFPSMWAIRDGFTVKYNGLLKFKAGSKIMIGGDLEFSNGGGFEVDGPGTIDVYVLGNFNGGNNSVSIGNVNLHVAGDFKMGYKSSDPAALKVNGSYNCPSDITHSTWSASEIEDIKRELNRETYSKTYKKWVVNGEDSTKSDYISGLDTAAMTAEVISIKLNSGSLTVDGVAGVSPTFTIAFPGSDSETDPTIPPECLAVCKAAGTKYPNAAGAVIKEVVGNFTAQLSDGGNPAVNTIVLDTGNDAKNIMFLRVCGYLADDGKTPSPSGNIFKWFPDSNTCCTLLVKGKGTVVIDIPEGVIYQDCDRQQTMHETWFKLLGGTEYDGDFYIDYGNGTNGTKSAHVYNSTAIQTDSAATAVKYIHAGCKKGDGCSYTEVDAKDKNGDRIECSKHAGEYKITVECSKHSTTSISAFCPKCDEFNKKKVEGLTSNKYTEGVCNNRLEEDKFIHDAGSLPSDIFLVNSSESAEIRLSGNGIIQNGFYGIVYAPYMTFKAEGISGNGANRLCGGLIVSDYAINDHYAFTNLYPQRMPDQLMGDSSDVLTGLTDKSWKISLGSY